MGQVNFDSDNSEIIAAIQDGVATETIRVERDEFLTREVYLPPVRPFASTLVVATLTALADYLNREIDKASRESVVVHIVSPTRVDVIKQITDAEDIRFCSLSAQADLPKINLILIGEFQSQANAMIELQSKFVQEGQLADTLASIGNIVLDEEIVNEDDGVTQRVAIQSGIERKFADITNPVSLKPFRTFAEVEQPSSPFVLRLSKDGNSRLLIALFEADGGKWRNEARQNIAAFLREQLDGEYSILA